MELQGWRQAGAGPSRESLNVGALRGPEKKGGRSGGWGGWVVERSRYSNGWSGTGDGRSGCQSRMDLRGHAGSLIWGRVLSEVRAGSVQHILRL